MARRKITEQAERTLDAWLAGLMEGQILLQDLPHSVSAWFHAGEAYGRASLQNEIEDLNHQLDLLYLQIVTPKERQREYQRRLTEHFTRESDTFFAPINPDLGGMAGQQLNSELTSIERDVSPQIGSTNASRTGQAKAA